MIITCPSCSARFQYDESRFQGAASKRFKCPKCAFVFEVINPAMQPPQEADGVFAGLTRKPASSVPDLSPPSQPPALPPIPPPSHPDGAPSMQSTVAGSLLPGEEPKAPSPVIEQDSPTLRAHTTARRDRKALLAEAGLVASALPGGMKYSLVCISGPLASRSAVFVLEKPRVVIGREEGDLITHDPETSRRHASLEVHVDGSAWLRDLGSTNGTLIDGERIGDLVMVTNRQEFTCGKSTFMVLIRPNDELF